MAGQSRSINYSNVFNINRLSNNSQFEEGQSVTVGGNYNIENLQREDQTFNYSLATVFRNEKSTSIPESSTINEKQSDIFGSFKNTFNENFSLNYNFNIDNSFNKFHYNDIKTTLNVNNFVTTFNFVEQNSDYLDTNTISNTTSYIIDDKNSFSFKSRRNRKINLTEYYDLIYEYKNDCLIAGIKFRKTYYTDREVRPKEDLLLTLTLVPLTTYEHRGDSWDF